MARYTDKHGNSHFGRVRIPLDGSSGPGGSISKLIRGAGVYFRQSPADYDFDYHPAPRRQFIVNLEQGQVDITVQNADGSETTSRLLPGQVFYVEDLEGTGHVSQAVESQLRHSLFIPVDGQEALLEMGALFFDDDTTSPTHGGFALGGPGNSVVIGEPQVLYDKICFPEAPRWNPDTQRFYFVNISSELEGLAGRVESVAVAAFQNDHPQYAPPRAIDHRVELDLAPVTGRNPSGLGWLPDGRMLIVSTGNFQLLAMEPGSGEVSVYADLSHHAINGKGMLNDMTVSATGHAYLDLYTSGRLCKIIMVRPPAEAGGAAGESIEAATELCAPLPLCRRDPDLDLDRDPGRGRADGRPLLRSAARRTVW